MLKFDFEQQKRGLDFCLANGMKARYHTLLDKQARDVTFKSMNPDDIKSELKEYVKKSIDFINHYNQEHDGTIISIDLFNEIISFPNESDGYKNMWNEIYKITTEDLVDIFKYAIENKPEGVSYLYNEPFLEDPARREAVLKQLNEINEISQKKYGKLLIDTLGTQMHITLMQDIDEIRDCFGDLKKLQDESGINIQITEFDMCMPNEVLFDSNGRICSESEIVSLINSGYGLSVESIAEFKKMKMNQITSAIRETGVELEGVSYWSISDVLDHNVQRTNLETFRGKERDVVRTRYAGLYSFQSVEHERQDDSQNIEETKDTAELDIPTTDTKWQYIIDILKQKIMRAKECECAVMQYLDESFEIPEEVLKTFEGLDLQDDFPTSSRIYLWKENFFKNKGLTPFNAQIDDYDKEAVEYMRATSPYCFGIDTSDMMLQEPENMFAEMALYALSLGASDEQVRNIMEWLKDERCIIPDESISDRYNVRSMEKGRVCVDDIAGTTIDYYQANNLLVTLEKLNDKGVARYIPYLMKNNVMSHPEEALDGVSVDDDGNHLFVSEGNHRLFTYKALKVIRDKTIGKKANEPSFNATIFHHHNHLKNNDQEI